MNKQIQGNKFTAEAEKNHFSEFINDLANSGRSERTLREYIIDWTSFSNWYMDANKESFEISRLTGLDLRDYCQNQLNKKYSVNTINRRLGLIKHYAAYAVENELLDVRIYKKLRQIPVLRKQQIAPRGLKNVDQRRFLKEVERTGTIRDRAIINLLAYTGLRIGEIVQLTIDDLHFSERKGFIIVRSESSKGHKQRQVPVVIHVRESILEYQQTRKNRHNSKQLFLGERGPLTVSGVNRIIKKYAARVGIELSAHQLRHTFAFAFLKSSNNNLVALADILGHESLSTTREYTRSRPEVLSEEIAKVSF